MTTTHKKPARHTVRAHKREGKIVHQYSRGSGLKVNKTKSAMSAFSKIPVITKMYATVKIKDKEEAGFGTFDFEISSESRSAHFIGTWDILTHPEMYDITKVKNNEFNSIV
jgi:hypothetical protein